MLSNIAVKLTDDQRYLSDDRSEASMCTLVTMAFVFTQDSKTRRILQQNATSHNEHFISKYFFYDLKSHYITWTEMCKPHFPVVISKSPVGLVITVLRLSVYLTYVF